MPVCDCPEFFPGVDLQRICLVGTFRTTVLTGARRAATIGGNVRGAVCMAHVLVVEDEQTIAEVIHYALTSEGMTVDTCRLLEQARERLGTGGIDALVLDANLPDGNGFDLLRELRQGGDLPVLMVTARSSEIDRVVGL